MTRTSFRDKDRTHLRDLIDVDLVDAPGSPACQAAGDGRESLRYLAPHVFRVAIGDHRIMSCDDGKVVFTCRKAGLTHTN
jgi:hypothetical protein